MSLPDKKRHEPSMNKTRELFDNVRAKAEEIPSKCQDFFREMDELSKTLDSYIKRFTNGKGLMLKRSKDRNNIWAQLQRTVNQRKPGAGARPMEKRQPPDQLAQAHQLEQPELGERPDPEGEPSPLHQVKRPRRRRIPGPKSLPRFQSTPVHSDTSDGPGLRPGQRVFHRVLRAAGGHTGQRRPYQLAQVPQLGQRMAGKRLPPEGAPSIQEAFLVSAQNMGRVMQAHARDAEARNSHVTLDSTGCLEIDEFQKLLLAHVEFCHSVQEECLKVHAKYEKTASLVEEAIQQLQGVEDVTES